MLNKACNNSTFKKEKTMNNLNKTKAIHKLKRDVKRDWQLYIFLLIPVIYILIFAYGPMSGLVIAFKDYKIRKGIFGSDWVGLDYFVKFFTSYQCKRVIKNTVILSMYNILASFPFPIMFALILNSMKHEKFKKVVQTISTMPHFISVVIMVGLLFQVLGSRTGLYGKIVMDLTGTYPENLFASPVAFKHIYVWSGVWQSFGWGSIVYTAALAGVAPEYHEAAQLDGASRFQRTIYIDLPSIMPTIVIMLILQMGKVMSLGFEKVFLLQNSLNISSSEVISTYVYQVGLASNSPDFSYATAIGMFNSVINLLMVTLVNKIAGKVGETTLW